MYHFAFSKYAAMISSRVSGLSAETCDFCEHVDFWLVAPKLILLFDKLGAADNVLELDRLSSTDRIVELSFKFSTPQSLLKFATEICLSLNFH